VPTRPKADRAQLRALASRLGPRFWEAVRLDPRADVPRYDPITGYRTWAEVEADPPQFTGLVTWLIQPEATPCPCDRPADAPSPGAES
jgi:hypothetical protein